MQPKIMADPTDPNLDVKSEMILFRSNDIVYN